jgi:hypothetical protein
MKADDLPLRELEKIHGIDFGVLGKWKKDGTNILSSKEVAIRAIKSQKPPAEWVEVKNIFSQDEDKDSHEYWKREETKEKVEKLRLSNSKLAGEMFEKTDGERIQEAWGSALSLALSERKATVPQMLAGKDEAWISDWMEEEDRKLMGELSDLESGLWKEVYERYSVVEESPANAAQGEGDKAKAKAKRK